MTIDLITRFHEEPAMLGHGNGSVAWFQHGLTNAARLLATYEADTTPPMMADEFWFSPDDWRSQYRPYKVVGGVLSIPIIGSLLNSFPWAISDYATGYDYIAAALKRGLEDEGVKGIALIVNSPGGMVSGNFELADKIFAARELKPIRALVTDGAMSAAYSLASSAESISMVRNGSVGSVGVVTMHVDRSKALSADGLKVTFIYAGKHKVDGNSLEALPDAVKSRIQDRIDAIYEDFAGIVARNRGMSVEAVKKTEALTYQAKEALVIGFADKIGAADDEFTAFQATFNQEDATNMATDTQAPKITQADLDAARAEGIAAGRAEGAQAAHDRIIAIMALPEAANRQTVAQAMAMKGSEGVDTVKAILASLPEEAKVEAKPEAAAVGAGAGAVAFAAAMSETQPPKIDGDSAKGDSDADLALIKGFGLPGFGK